MSISKRLVNKLDATELKSYIELDQKIKDLDYLLKQSEYSLLAQETQIKDTKTYIEFLGKTINQFKDERTNMELKANVRRLKNNIKTAAI